MDSSLSSSATPLPLVICLALGCGSTALSEDDCREPENACVAPFQCDAESGTFRCATTSYGTDACRGVPGTSPLDVQLTPDRIPIHHLLLEACLQVTYEPALEERRPALETALARWEAVSCNRLCFEGPVLSATSLRVETRERRFHLRVGAPMTGGDAESLLFFEASTGRAFGCEVTLPEDDFETTSAADLLAMLMGCAGFAPGAATNTVLSPQRVEDGIETLTELDEAALCAMYGTPSYCSGEESRFSE